jgi:heptosyltransferase-2
VRVLETGVDCRPCYRRRCPIDHRCMTGIAPERAIEAADALLARAAAAGVGPS